MTVVGRTSKDTYDHFVCTGRDGKRLERGRRVGSGRTKLSSPSTVASVDQLWDDSSRQLKRNTNDWDGQGDGSVIGLPFQKHTLFFSTGSYRFGTVCLRCSTGDVPAETGTDGIRWLVHGTVVREVTSSYCGYLTKRPTGADGAGLRRQWWEPVVSLEWRRRWRIGSWGQVSV